MKRSTAITHLLICGAILSIIFICSAALMSMERTLLIHFSDNLKDDYLVGHNVIFSNDSLQDGHVIPKEGQKQKYILEQEQEGSIEIPKTKKSKDDQEMRRIDPRIGGVKTRMESQPSHSKVYILNESDDITPPTVITNTTLNLPDSSIYPIYTDGCCGVGHRLSRNIPTIVYANHQRRKAKILWRDVPWSNFFKETDYFTHGNKHDNLKKVAKENDLFIANKIPKGWTGNTTSTSKINRKPRRVMNTALDQYEKLVDLLDNPHSIAIMVLLRDSLTPLVLSFLNPIRAQLNQNNVQNNKTKHNKHLSVCIHVRQGNNETGDWERKKERQIPSLETVLISTQRTIKDLILLSSARNVVTHTSIFVASDNPSVQPWFRKNSPPEWTIVKPGKIIPKPTQGVWFGEYGSLTNSVLDAEEKRQAMAETLAEIFALGECDVLMIPKYSSFTCTAIALSKTRGIPIFFGKQNGENFEYHEMKNII